jgi:hypothetical protein
MAGSELTFFVHLIDGHPYGGWYRLISDHEIEVISAALMETVTYAGYDAEAAARSVLENFVRERCAAGSPLHDLNLGELAQGPRESGPSPASVRAAIRASDPPHRL